MCDRLQRLGDPSRDLHIHWKLELHWLCTTVLWTTLEGGVFFQLFEHRVLLRWRGLRSIV